MKMSGGFSATFGRKGITVAMPETQSQPVIADIEGFETVPMYKVPLDELMLYHKNPRKGDTAKLARSLRRNTQYKPIVVNRGTNATYQMEVLVGNHTLMAIRELAQDDPRDPRWFTVLVHFVDVDDQDAARINVVDNKSHEGGSYDNELLAEVLSDLPDLSGTGYSDDELAKLLGGKPTEGDADVDDNPTVYGVIVECETEAQQVNLLDKLSDEGFTVRALM